MTSPDDQPELPLPPAARFIKRLVIVLTVVTVAGFLTLIGAVLVILNRDISLPDQITLPDGAVATAFTQGAGWYAVVTSDNRILIFDRATGALSQTIQISTEVP
jgi:hypothetical protein